MSLLKQHQDFIRILIPWSCNSNTALIFDVSLPLDSQKSIKLYSILRWIIAALSLIESILSSNSFLLLPH